MLYALNAGLRFVLEIGALIALGRWGRALGDGFFGYVLAGVLPLTAAVLWGVFTVPGDPSRGKDGPVPVSGVVRLSLEAGFFTAGAWALVCTGQALLGAVFGASVCLHYAFSGARIRWLLVGGKAQ